MSEMSRRTLLSLLVSGTASPLVMSADRRAMIPCSVDFPRHTLTFAVPAEVAGGMNDMQINSRFDPAEGFVRGFQPLTSTMYDFNGPFWVGAIGSLKFHAFMIERSADFQGEISTAEGLEKYVAWWLKSGLKGGILRRIVLNGTPVVSRRFGDYIERISFPINEQMFLDFGLSVEGIPGGRSSSKSWISKAVAMRDAIRASLVFRPKPPPVPSDHPTLG